MKTVVTFKDLYEYIQTAERDETGMHIPTSDNKNFKLHIYEGKKQANIYYKKDNALPTMKVLFSEDESIILYFIDSKGITDYDNQVEIPIHTLISEGVKKLALTIVDTLIAKKQTNDYYKIISSLDSVNFSLLLLTL